ncbi:MAG TPA: beta-glucosidase BglX [Terriglobales bacterium]
MAWVRSTIVGCAVMLLMCCCAWSQSLTNDATEQRINALIQQMTLDEKIDQLVQLPTATQQTPDLVQQGKTGSIFNVLGAQTTNDLQKIAVEKSRLKIPLLIGYDVIHGYRTIFPVPIASAGSFDPEMIEQSERVAAKEASASGVRWVFAPMLDIARDPRWGRMVEGPGQDPYLASVIAVARVHGFQGQNLAAPDSVVASIKHYVAYGAAEGGRDYNTVDISEQLLREVYLPPFEAAVKAGAGTVMASFEDLNGVPATANHHTLSDILRGEWKFQGMVVSDYGAVDELMVHGVAADEGEASAKALTAGVDMDMADGAYGRTLASLVQSGKLPVSVLDEAVRRVLRIKFATGLFDHPYTDPAREKAEILSPENLQVARKMAQESMVLLKNQNNLLPLNKNAGTIAVIGPLSDDKGDQLGPWAGQGRAADAISPLEGIKAKVPNVKVIYAKGVDLEDFPNNSNVTGAAPAPVSATGAGGAHGTGVASIPDAVEAANKADVVIMFLGELAGMTGEASSRATLDFPGKQKELLEAVAATGKPIVLVLESGRPLDIRWANDHIPAIIQGWFLGVQAGNSIADVLFGDVSPSAKLPLSWPLSVGQIPIYYDHKNTGRPTSPDRWHTGYLDESKEPLFPFGYGLTYTTFKYSNLEVTTPSIAANDDLHVSAELQNTGSREATEVVQLYVHDRVAPTSRPVKELKGFSRVTLGSGQSKSVDFTIHAQDLGSYDPTMKWIVPSGTYDVWIGPSSADGEHATFVVKP